MNVKIFSAWLQSLPPYKRAYFKTHCPNGLAMAEIFAAGYKAGLKAGKDK